ncbi:MAG: alpha-amylase family glycosyl hydrolase [Candidatus Enteromonas sp.]|nr:alpha-amylase family glycosyl hydrolase [Candidatus Enteromonas sp.]
MKQRYRDFLKLNFYQIYPKSFKDSNNDGIGDFNGITEKIPYLAELGINAVWLSPCFESPGVDSGYDISDYRKVGPEFGTMEDFKKMIDTFHAHGIKVIVDLVVNHCSTQHRWFQEALKGPSSPYYDYFYWFDEKPNDWQSCFGGTAYEYVPSLKKYYYHAFSVEQADLNWENPRVRKEVCDIVDFWIDFGVDGFRCDVLDMVSKDFKNGISSNGPRLHEFLHEVFGREKCKNIYTVGECWGTTDEEVARLTGEDRGELVTAFRGGHPADLGPRFQYSDHVDYSRIHDHFAEKMEVNEKLDLVFPPFFENHDQCRCVSKLANDKELRYESATFFATILYTLRGTPFILQGQEFGTPSASYSSVEDFNDVETLNFYRAHKGTMEEEELLALMSYDTRDNGRRPMVWDDTPTGGFNDGAKPWLALHSERNRFSLAKDLASEKSIFRFFQKMIAFRKSSDALMFGHFEDATEERKDCFLFYREEGNEKLFIAINYDKPSHIDIPEGYESVFGNYDTDPKGEFRPFETRIYKKK